MPDANEATDDAHRLNRRRALTALGAGAGTLVGVGAFSGTAAAWGRFDVCFRGCSEVWMIVSEADVGRSPPTVAQVIVATGGEAVCQEVEFTEANATTIPGQFGDAPVVKYAPGGDDKILGVLEYDYGTGEPVYCVTVNENNCATAPGTPSVHDAPCVPDDHPVCAEGDFCGGTGGGNGGDQQRGNGRGQQHGNRGNQHHE